MTDRFKEMPGLLECETDPFGGEGEHPKVLTVVSPDRNCEPKCVKPIFSRPAFPKGNFLSPGICQLVGGGELPAYNLASRLLFAPGPEGAGQDSHGRPECKQNFSPEARKFRCLQLTSLKLDIPQGP